MTVCLIRRPITSRGYLHDAAVGVACLPRPLHHLQGAGGAEEEGEGEGESEGSWDWSHPLPPVSFLLG
jgi:hypothetical protein